MELGDEYDLESRIRFFCAQVMSSGHHNSGSILKFM